MRRSLLSWSLTLSALVLAAPSALAHVGQPRAILITFPAAAPDATFVITDGQGLFADPKGEYQWLCEDAIDANAGVRGVALDADDPERWLVATIGGGYHSDDGGCTFSRVEGPVGSHRLVGLWSHPLDPTLWVGSATEDTVNDLFRSDDGGRTWAPAGLGLRGFARVFLRAPDHPERIYLSHTHGLVRSDDGGETFVDVPLDDPIFDDRRDDFRLLAIGPDGPDTVFAAIEDIRGTALIRSTDAGVTWTQVGEIRDFGLQMIFDPATGDGLVGGPVGIPQRSDDGGLTWAAVDAPPLPRCLIVAPDGRLWGCQDPYFGAAWAVGVSGDFGRTWDAVLPRYEVVTERWDCALDSPARTCCTGLCPGLMVPPDACGQPEPPADQLEQCTQPPGIELTPLDGGIDAAPEPDAAPLADAGTDAEPIDDAAAPAADMLPPAGGDDTEGCVAAPGAGSTAPWWLLCLAPLGIRSRRRSS